MAKGKILLVLTGGTICSFDRGDGECAADTHRAEALIVRNYQKNYGERVQFDPRFPLDLLSENMTVTDWNTLKDAFRSYDFSDYDGIILLHGTDTLAYTASLLSLLLWGVKIPVLLVSAQLPLTSEQTNGNENFRAAVELIEQGLTPSVYAVYRNSDGVTYLHLGAHLRQCTNHSDDFFSTDMMPLPVEKNPFSLPEQNGDPLLYTCEELTPSVLRIEPYVGLDYAHFSLDGVRAVLHGTYHSCTVATAPDGSASLRSLLERCREKQIPVFLSPCDEHAYTYETTGDALRSGAIALSQMTPEMTYVKLLVGLSLSLLGKDLENFLKTEHCGEFIF